MERDESMSGKKINDTEPARLAKLLQFSDGDGRLWRTEELGAILHHQLNVPVQFDLCGFGQGAAKKVRIAADAQTAGNGIFDFHFNNLQTQTRRNDLPQRHQDTK